MKNNSDREMNTPKEQITAVTDRIKAKLQTLCLPLCVLDGEEVGPLPVEVQAATQLLLWYKGQVEQWISQLEAEPMRRRQMWPNVNVWSGMISALKGLPRLQDPDYQHAFDALMEQCQQMMRVAPGASQLSKVQQRDFLPRESQRMEYKEHVINYYNRFLASGQLKHKEQMLHWAAIYHAIARKTGIENLPFQGPDFDNFIYNYCGIAYNKADNPRGRYRTVNDVLTRCLAELAEGKVRSLQSPQTQAFVAARNEMKRLTDATTHTPADAFRGVPKQLF